MKNLKTIIDECSQSVDFPFMGGTFTASKERNVYNEIHKKYQSLTPVVMEQFKQYHDNFTGVIDLLSTVSDKLVSSINVMLKEICQDAISMGVMTIDPISLAKECSNDFYFEPFYDVLAGYEACVKQAESQCQVSTGRMYFHRIGDAEAHMQAGLHNALTGAVENAFANAQFKSALKKIYKEQSFHKQLTDSVEACCNALRNNVMYI
jgi:hypothetical protein